MTIIRIQNLHYPRHLRYDCRWNLMDESTKMIDECVLTSPHSDPSTESTLRHRWMTFVSSVRSIHTHSSTCAMGFRNCDLRSRVCRFRALSSKLSSANVQASSSLDAAVVASSENLYFNFDWKRN